MSPSTRGSPADVRARFMFDKMMPLSEAVEGYRMFDAMEVQKVIFTT